jgi:hypothetical protein
LPKLRRDKKQIVRVLEIRGKGAILADTVAGATYWIEPQLLRPDYKQSTGGALEMSYLRSIKMLGLAAIAAVAAMAFIGASSASAVVLCKSSATPCPTGSKYPAKTVLLTKVLAGTKAVLSGTLKVECSESTSTGETSTEEGSPLKGLLTGLTFNTCTNCKKAVAENLPGAVELTGEGAGKFVVKGIAVTLEECPFGAVCLAEPTGGEAKLEAKGGSGGSEAADAELSAVKVPVTLKTLKGFGCGSTGEWNAKYYVFAADVPGVGTVTNPPVFVR